MEDFSEFAKCQKFSCWFVLTVLKGMLALNWNPPISFIFGQKGCSLSVHLSGNYEMRRDRKESNRIVVKLFLTKNVTNLLNCCNLRIKIKNIFIHSFLCANIWVIIGIMKHFARESCLKPFFPLHENSNLRSKTKTIEKSLEFHFRTIFKNFNACLTKNRL